MTRHLLLLPVLALLALIGYYAAEYFYGTRRIQMRRASDERKTL